MKNNNSEINTTLSNSIVFLSKVLKDINDQLDCSTDCNPISVDSFLRSLKEIILAIKCCQKNIGHEKGSLLQMCNHMGNGIIFYHKCPDKNSCQNLKSANCFSKRPVK